MRLRHSILALAAAAAMSSAAYAGVTVTFNLVDTNASSQPTAVANDPRLANSVTYDMVVATNGGDDWLSAEIHGVAGNGATYYDSNSNDSNFMQSAFWGFVPQLRFDTALGPNGNGNNVTILGAFQGGPGGGPSGSSVSTFSGSNHTVWDMDVGDTETTTNTSFTLYRFTILNAGATGTYFNLDGNVSSTNVSQQTFHFQLPVPEPMSAGMLALGLGAVALRRRK